VLSAGGREQLVAFTGNSAVGVAPDSGAVLWRYPYVTNYECNIATPLAYEGRIFLSSGENHGSVLLALTPRGEGFDLRPVWESLGASSVMRNEWQTSLLLDGYLYGMDNVGGAGPITHLTCVSAATGERKWQQTRFGKGNLIAADGKLFISTMKGELVIVRATPDRYEDASGSRSFLSSAKSAQGGVPLLGVRTILDSLQPRCTPSSAEGKNARGGLRNACRPATDGLDAARLEGERSKVALTDFTESFIPSCGVVPACGKWRWHEDLGKRWIGDGVFRGDGHRQFFSDPARQATSGRANAAVRFRTGSCGRSSGLEDCGQRPAGGSLAVAGAAA
jgi:hypothetical protein